MLAIILQLTINSLIAGAIYALVAVGFSLIYATNRFVHLAHGAVVAAAAFALFLFWNSWQWPVGLAIVASVAVSALLGTVLYYGIYWPLMGRGASAVILLVASIGLLIFLQNALLLFLGADVKTLPAGVLRMGVEFSGAVITYLQLIIIGVAAILFAGVYFFMKYTRPGKRIRAVTDHPELARITGINVARVQLVGFLIGSALAGVAGVLIALEQNIEPYMGTHLIVKGYTSSVIGGFGSVPGAILGSAVVGAAENFGIWYLPSGYKDAITFVSLLIFLLARPQGILGVRFGARQ